MRLHLVGLPHTNLTDEFSWCAFTSLAKTFATMMTACGYEVIVYWGPDNEAMCAEHVVCHDAVDTKPNVPDFSEEQFEPMNVRVITELAQRLGPRDIICLMSGYAQGLVSSAFPNHIQVEPLVGYAGTIAKHRVFPSYAWMHLLYGAWQRDHPQAVNGHIGDAVIPHFLDPSMFPMGTGGEYLLFAARLNWDKGMQIAVDVSKRSGIPLKIIGHGTPPEHGEYLGVVGPKERADLMGGALAVLSPSLYCEPFCLVAVEAQMCGTPAITTDWGAFAETVEHDITGFRCRTDKDFDLAVLEAGDLDRFTIRSRALAMYSTDMIGPLYADYFDRISQAVWG